MAFNRIQARPLCTNAEYTLFTSSLAGGVTELTPAQLRSKIERTRKLRDKYRDLFKRQRLANRARTGTRMGERPDTNERTRDKATLFDETLGRFEARAAKLAAAAERDARRKAVREARSCADGGPEEGRREAGRRSGPGQSRDGRPQTARDSRLYQRIGAGCRAGQDGARQPGRRQEGTGDGRGQAQPGAPGQPALTRPAPGRLRATVCNSTVMPGPGVYTGP
jgi:hypothetical protein